MEPEALAQLPRLPAAARCGCGAAIEGTGHVTAGPERLPLHRCPACGRVYVLREPRPAVAVRHGPAAPNPVLDPETARLILQRLRNGAP